MNEKEVDGGDGTNGFQKQALIGRVDFMVSNLPNPTSSVTGNTWHRARWYEKLCVIHAASSREMIGHMLKVNNLIIGHSELHTYKS